MSHPLSSENVMFAKADMVRGMCSQGLTCVVSVAPDKRAVECWKAAASGCWLALARLREVDDEG